jgi:hypothetical protein
LTIHSFRNLASTLLLKRTKAKLKSMIKTSKLLERDRTGK